MPRNRDIESSAVGLLATTFVMAGGILLCAFMSVALTSHPEKPFLISAGFFSGMAILLWRLRNERARETTGGNIWHRWCRWSRPSDLEYRPKRRQAEVRYVEFGTNIPPSAETVRDLVDGLHTWVPSQTSDSPQDSQFRQRDSSRTDA